MGVGSEIMQIPPWEEKPNEVYLVANSPSFKRALEYFYLNFLVFQVLFRLEGPLKLPCCHILLYVCFSDAYVSPQFL